MDLPFRFKSVCALALLATAIPQSYAQGPGLGNLTYSSGQVGKVISLVTNREGHGWVAMHRGYLIVIFSKDGGLGNGAISILNVSNPLSPVVHSVRDDSMTQTLREPHGWGMRGDIAVLQGNLGMQFWDFSDMSLPKRISSLPLSGIQISDYDLGLWWTHWQGGYVYGGGSSNGLYIVDARDPANPSLVKRIATSQLGGFRVGPVHAIGNLLILSSHDAAGASLLDISDPVNPRLLSVISPSTSGTASYASLVNGNKLVFAGANISGVNNDGRLLIYDISDPSNPVSLGKSGVLPSSSGSGDNKGGYVGFQDGHVFAGFSTRGFAKIDLGQAGFPVLLTGSSDLTNSDEDFAVPLGNLVFLANDHPGQGSGLLPHQARPDSLGPRVNMISPRDSAVGQAITSRVGATFTDQIDAATLHDSSFIVRPVGGARVAGWYAVQAGIVNFQPEAPLQPGTLYEVIVTTAVKDITGNPNPQTFRSTFRTAGSSAIVPSSYRKKQGNARLQGASPMFQSGDRPPVDARGRVRDLPAPISTPDP